MPFLCQSTTLIYPTMLSYLNFLGLKCFYSLAGFSTSPMPLMSGKLENCSSSRSLKLIKRYRGNKNLRVNFPEGIMRTVEVRRKHKTYRRQEITSLMFLSEEKQRLHSSGERVRSYRLDSISWLIFQRQASQAFSSHLNPFPARKFAIKAR